MKHIHSIITNEILIDDKKIKINTNKRNTAPFAAALNMTRNETAHVPIIINASPYFCSPLSLW